ncbi:hypothetical protein [Streptosporangium lutulentum]|uniref:Immunity protein Imm1 n=1 Tax=Streptosporangium lutulentum TaxID=1461250 RepID=A0ABT9QU91_9ACTN|nr:hypothetical protein [Streptosporangium lutulentum]MDP9850343.1 hypothetical protein [Streptosporangium lutulentum]
MKPWQQQRWSVIKGCTVRPSRWPDGLTAFYSGYVGTADELVEAMRTMGRCGQAIKGKGGHPDEWAREIRQQQDDDQVWCVVWDESPIEMWDGSLNAYSPEHVLAIATPPGMSSMGAAHETHILAARLKVARAEWELAELLGEPRS